MIMLNTGLITTLYLLTLLSTVQSYHWPSPRYDQLEGLLYERTTEEGSRMPITQPLNSCRAISPSSNENAAANWLRMAFHDMATHDIDTGLGGVDASIYFELGYRGVRLYF